MTNITEIESTYKNVTSGDDGDEIIIHRGTITRHYRSNSKRGIRLFNALPDKVDSWFMSDTLDSQYAIIDVIPSGV